MLSQQDIFFFLYHPPALSLSSLICVSDLSMFWLQVHNPLIFTVMSHFFSSKRPNGWYQPLGSLLVLLRGWGWGVRISQNCSPHQIDGLLITAPPTIDNGHEAGYANVRIPTGAELWWCGQFLYWPRMFVQPAAEGSSDIINTCIRFTPTKQEMLDVLRG